ncbi:HNH endonuclease [Roseburia hominis]
MIKLERGLPPEELTEEVKSELTRLYTEDKAKDVWNSPKIKKPLKSALLQMSHGKCSYCECVLEIESKDATIDHFLPKSSHMDKVVEWKNLFPACLRCNRKKNDNENRIVNPCEDDPKEYLALWKENPYRLKGIDPEKVGRNTILAVGLNDVDRVMVPRMTEWEDIHQRLEDIYEDLQEEGYKEKYKRRMERVMEKCTVKNSYAAVKSTNMLNDTIYIEIKKIFEHNGVWTEKFKGLEKEMQRIALEIV